MKKIGWMIFSVWFLTWTACGLSTVAFEPIITGDNINQVAQNAPAVLMKAMGFGILEVIGGLMILGACGIFGRKRSN